MAQEIIKSLSKKIARVIEDNERLQREYLTLDAKKDKLNAENRELKQTIASLEKRLNILELGNSLTSGGSVDKKQARARINRLMREIDRCIALMNKQ